MTTKAKFPGWRTMTRAQRYNAKADAFWASVKDVKTRFNAESRIEATNTRGGSANLGVLNPLSQDQAEIARRLAAARLRPAKPQEPCDLGLFSDSIDQPDML